MLIAKYMAYRIDIIFYKQWHTRKGARLPRPSMPDMLPIENS